MFSEWLCLGEAWAVGQMASSAWRATLGRLVDSLRAAISEMSAVLAGRGP